VALSLTGTVVTFDRSRPLIDRGAVYVGDDGRLAGVGRAADPPPAGFANATRIDTGSVIYPGLIDLHNHFAYDTLPLWRATGVPYIHHDRWPGETKSPAYSTSITWPARVLGQAAPEALLKYVEVKALVGGTTSIQGAPLSTRPVDGWLLRIVDDEKLPGGKDLVMCAALQRDISELRRNVKRTGVADKLDDGQVMIYHAAEGQRRVVGPGDFDVAGEFDDLANSGCLQPGLIGVHATALEPADFALWRDEVKGIDATQKPSLVWSPFSNYWLYHSTTDVIEADKKGFRICLGSDWSPSGTKHVLGELKVADALNRGPFGGRFSDLELCEMVTANSGDALAVAWGPQIGRLRAGNAADILVCERHDADPYRNLIEATERHVRLVLVRGTPFYGTRPLMTAAGVQAPNLITVRGQQRALVVRQPGRADATLDWPGVRAALETVRNDPQAAWQGSLDALAAWGGALDDPEAPLALFGDMPEGDLGLLGASGEIPADLVIPPLQSLTHDAAFLAAVAAAGPPELQALRGYYT
jgi:5-methylthioadenosine/S-adenosylhomocysteine deaminase